MKKLALLAISVLVLASCRSGRGPMAMANVNATSGSTVKGTVHFQEQDEGEIEVVIDLTGVPPGVHGFHIHDKGDCSDNGNAAGGHFNPAGMPHGAPDAQSHHAGDFGNITAEANGEVHTRFTTHFITLKEGPNYVVGHAVIVHGNPDDLVTQPTGNAGPRIGCGIVTLMSADQMHH